MILPETIDGGPLAEGLPTAFYALAEFYNAFNARDHQRAAHNWHRGPVAMSNPIGGIRRDWQAIHDGYQRIMTGPARVYVEFFEFLWHQSDDMFFVAGRERGYLEQDDVRLALRIRTSRIYRLLDNRWQQVHHHGSMDEPQLLARYQQAILGDAAPTLTQEAYA